MLVKAFCLIHNTVIVYKVNVFRIWFLCMNTENKKTELVIRVSQIFVGHTEEAFCGWDILPLLHLCVF